MSPGCTAAWSTLRELDEESAKGETESWKEESALCTTLQLLISTQTLIPARVPWGLCHGGWGDGSGDGMGGSGWERS